MQYLNLMSDRSERTAVGVIAVLAALGGAMVTSSLTGMVAADRCWTAALAAIITIAAVRAGRPTLVWLIAVAIAAGIGSPWVIAGGVALALVGVSTRMRSGGSLLAALAGGAGAIALLHPAASVSSAMVAAAVVAATVPLVLSAIRSMAPVPRRRIIIGGAAALAALGVSVAVAAVVGLSTAPTLRSGVDAAHAGITSTRDGDLGPASDSFATSRSKFARAASALDAPWLLPARLVPVLGANLEAARAVVDDGLQLATAAQTSVEAAPYDQIRLTGGGIDLSQVTAMQQPVATLDLEVADVQRSLAAIDTTWLLPTISSRIADFSEQIDSVAPQLQTATLAMQALPDMLGADAPRTYLVEFTSESESRFLGGFVGSYALLTADHGRLTLDRSESVSSLNRRLGPDVPYVASSEFIDLYDRFHPQMFAQNWSVAPDLPSDAAMVEQLFAHATGIHVDGVIVIDPFGLAGLLKLTGPIRVPGISQQLTAANAAEYLLHGQYLEFAGQTDQRRDQLAAVAQKAFDELMKSPRTNYRDVSRALGASVRDGHIMFSAFDPTAQALLDRLGLTRRFTLPRDAVLFSFRNSASFANKIDYFLHRDLTIDATIDPRSNRLEADITVALRNDAPGSGLPAYIIGNENGEPSGTNGMYFSIYTTGPITGATLDGTAVELGEQPDRGMRVFSKGITIAPGGTKVLRFHISEVIPPTAAGFRFALPHQPTVNPDQLTFIVHSTDPALVPRSLSGLADATVELGEGTLRATAPVTTDQTLTVPFARR